MRDGSREAAQSLGSSTFVAESAEHAYKVLDSQNIDVVLLDMKLPGANGLEILQQVKTRKPDAEVIVNATMQSAVAAMKLGAYHYVTKPFNLQELRLLLEWAASQLASENRLLREKIKAKQGFAGIAGRAPEMTVLIVGESGSGRECLVYDVLSALRW